MKYFGVIVDVLFRTVEQITGEHDHKPPVEHASNFCTCHWYSCGTTKNDALIAEFKALAFEVSILQMFRDMNIKNPSKFVEISNKCGALQ